MMKTRIFVLIVSGAMALTLALWARFGLIEPEGLALACASSQAWHCTLRELVVATFDHQQLGIVALVASLFALLPKLRALAWLGWVCGIAGLVLYSWDCAAVGTVLALLVIAHTASNTHNAAHA
ncbi:MAG: hypothetical protein LBV44_07180 [Methylobacillus sp.]|jgi:hypothetical protein|nr:hypothetical protein [Methylobacillus sp.]